MAKHLKALVSQARRRFLQQQRVQKDAAAQDCPVEACLSMNSTANRDDHFRNRRMKSSRDKSPIDPAASIAQHRANERTRIDFQR